MPIPSLPTQAQLPPDLAGQLAQLQMRQQLSQALLGQSMQPTNPLRSSGRYIVPISPLEGLSKMASTALLGKSVQDNNSKEMNLYAQANQRRNDALSNALMQGSGGGLPPGLQSPQQTDPNGAPGFNVVPGQPTSGQNLSGRSVPGGRETLQDIYSEAAKLAPAYGTDMLTILGSPLYEARIKAAQQDAQRTDLQKNMGDPSLADWRKKETFIPPTVVRDNSVALDSNGNQILNNPTPSPGTYNTWQPGNPNPSGNVPIPGAAQNIGDLNYAKLYQEAMAKLEMMKNSSGQIEPKTQANLAKLPPPANWVPPGKAPVVAPPVVTPNAPPQAQPPLVAPVAPAAPPRPPGPPAMPFTPPQAPAAPPNAVQTQVPQNNGQITATPLRNEAPLAQKAFPWQSAPQSRQQAGVFGPTISSEAEQSARGKDLAAQMQTIDNSANSAAIVSSRIGEMRGLLQNFTPGALAPLKEKIGAVALGLGVSEDSPLMKQIGSVGDMQAFGKLALNLAFEQTKQLTNRPAASEVMLALKANPNLALTPQGIAKIMDYMDAMSNYQLAKQQTAQAWKTEAKGPKTLEGFDAWFNKTYKILDFLPKGAAQKTQPPSTPQFTREEIDAEMRRRGLKGAPSGEPVQSY